MEGEGDKGLVASWERAAHTNKAGMVVLNCLFMYATIVMRKT